jgi:outer membrane murein-binding lipoprotein Lpp
MVRLRAKYAAGVRNSLPRAGTTSAPEAGQEEFLMRWLPLVLIASVSLLAGCATTGSVEDLEKRVSALESRSSALEDQVKGAQATAEQAMRRAESAESAARASAESADASARKADAIFRKGVSK